MNTDESGKNPKRVYRDAELIRLNKRKTYIDWQSAEQRMAGQEPSHNCLLQLTRGVVCIGLVLLMLWFLHNVLTTDYIPNLFTGVLK